MGTSYSNAKVYSNNTNSLHNGFHGGRWKLDKPIQGFVDIECRYTDCDNPSYDEWEATSSCYHNVDTKALVTIPANQPIVRSIELPSINNGEIYHPQPEKTLRTNMVIVEKIYGKEINKMPGKELFQCSIKYDRWNYKPMWFEVGKTNTFDNDKFSSTPSVKSSIENGFIFRLPDDEKN